MIDVYALIRRKGKKASTKHKILGRCREKEEAQDQRDVEIKFLCSLTIKNMETHNKIRRRHVESRGAPTKDKKIFNF
jgi:hypothetical protein